MKTTGIILLVLGCLSTLGGLASMSNGGRANFSGLGLVVLGAFVISRANMRKEEAEKKKKWEEGSDSN
jgi:hypothetical protein